MRIKTGVKAAGKNLNHNEKIKRLRIKSNVKAGGVSLNHGQAIRRTGLKVRSGVKAGGVALNHNQGVKRGLRIKSNLKAGRRGGDCDEFGCGTNHNQTIRKG